MAEELSHEVLLRSVLKFQKHPEVIHDGGTKLTARELLRVNKQLDSCNYDMASYPGIFVARSGEPHYKIIRDENGDVVGKYFVFMCLDYNHIKELPDPQIVPLFGKLTDHIRGDIDEHGQKTGFRRVSPSMVGNRDGGNTAFTQGITAPGMFYVAPVKHASDSHTTPYVQEWRKDYHCLSGDLAGRFMRCVMSESYQEWVEARRDASNPPCFGPEFQSQSYFTTSQINASCASTQLKGTAAAAHADTGDDPTSFSLIMNVSVVRPTTKLGFLWMLDFDTFIEVKPLQFILFPGVEQHRGSPILVDPSDRTPLPHGYTEDHRYTLVHYPKSCILNDSLPRNVFGHLSNIPDRPNLSLDAFSSIGGTPNLKNWLAREIMRSVVKQFRTSPALIGGTMDPRSVLQSVELKDIYGPGALVPYISRARAELAVDSTPFQVAFRRLSQLLRANRRQPLAAHVAGNVVREDVERVRAAAAGRVHSREYLTPHARVSPLATKPSASRPMAKSKLSSTAGDFDQSSTAAVLDESNAAAELNESNTAPELAESSTAAESDENVSDPAVHPNDLSHARDSCSDIESDRRDQNRPPNADELRAYDLFNQSVLESKAMLVDVQSSTAPGASTSQHGFRVKKGVNFYIRRLPSTDNTGNPVVGDAEIADFVPVYSTLLSKLGESVFQSMSVTAGVNAVRCALLLEAIVIVEKTNFDLVFENDWAVPSRSITAALVDQILTCLGDVAKRRRTKGLVAVTVTFSALSLLGPAAYEPSYHQDANVTFPSTMALRSPGLPSRLFRELLLRMFLVKPLAALKDQFQNHSRNRGWEQRSFVPGSFLASSIYRTMKSRALLLSGMCETLSTRLGGGDKRDALYLDALLPFVFGYRSGCRVTRKERDAILTLISRDFADEVKLMKDLVVAAKKRFDTTSFLKTRGTEVVGRFVDAVIPWPGADTNKRPALADPSQRRTKRAKTCPTVDKESIMPSPEAAPFVATDPRIAAIVDLLRKVYTLSNIALDTPNRQHLSTTLAAPAIAHPEIGDTGLDATRFLKKITSSLHPSCVEWDKYMAYRRHSKSFRLIAQLTSPHRQRKDWTGNVDSLKNILRILMWGRLAYGKLDFISALADCRDESDVQRALSECETEETLRRQWAGAEPVGKVSYLTQPVYGGRCRITDKEWNGTGDPSGLTLPQHLYSKIEMLAPGLAELWCHAHGRTPSFRAVYCAFVRLGIRRFQKDSLCLWLTICDLADMGFCELPTIVDLVAKLTRSSARGPRSGVSFACFQVNAVSPEKCSSKEWENLMTGVFDRLSTLCGDEFRGRTGSVFSVADLEHGLCKISRCKRFM